MPKPKPDNIIRHEIILGRTERDMLDTVIAGMTFNRVMVPVVDLLKDVSALSVIILFLEATGIIDIDKGILGDVLEKIKLGTYAGWDEIKEAMDEAIALYEETMESTQEFIDDPLGTKSRLQKAKNIATTAGMAAIYYSQQLRDRIPPSFGGL